MTKNFALDSWERVQIGSVCYGIYDGLHATPKPASKGAIFLGIKNITEDGRLDLSEIRYIAEDDFATWTKRAQPLPGDIVFVYEATLNRYAIIPKGFRGCLEHRLAVIKPNPDKVDNRFLFYYFFGEDWRRTIAKNILSGSTVDRIPISSFPTFEISLPPLSTQRKIADILSNYDRLIENNTRRIKILEEMAQLLYREWFVSFRFPGYEQAQMVESSLGLIPKDWRVELLPVLCSKVIDGTHDSPKPVEHGYYLVTGKHLVNGFIDFSKCYLISDEEHQKVMKRSKPEKGDIIYSNIGTLGSTVLVDQNFEFSIKNVALFKPIKPFFSTFLYLFFSSPDTLELMLRKASGTSQRFLSLQFFRNLSLLCPPEGLLMQFDSLVKPILEQRSTLYRKNLNLRQTRDLLLPKLISGEIDIEGIATSELEAIAA